VSDDPPAPSSRPEPPRPGRRWLLLGIQSIVTVGLLALLWQVADGGAALEALATANPVWMLAAVLALTLHTLLAAERWRLTAGALGLPLTRRLAVREYYLAQLVNSTVPGGVVGDAGRAVRSRGPAGLAVAAQAVVVERFAGQVALLATMTIAVAAVVLVPGGLELPTAIVGLAATVALIGAGLIGLVVAGAFGARLLPGRAGTRAAELGRTSAVALADRRVVGAQLGLSAGTTASILAAFAFSALSVGVALPFAAIIALVPLVLLTMLVPITISGWGLREGAAAALLPVAGIAASDALAASVAFGLLGLVAVLPGLLGVWGRRG
jgi:uncharacterized membrane protein YbhN (UPF0104 family)